MKKLVSSSLLAALLCINFAYASPAHTEKDIVLDPAYKTIVEKARTDLQNRGYQIKTIEADKHDGKDALAIKATKNGLVYDICLDYPSLKAISEKRKD